MSHLKSAPFRLQFVLSSLLAGSCGLGLVATMATSSGCKQEQSVSANPPSPDAEMKKVVINVFGMT